MKRKSMLKKLFAVKNTRASICIMLSFLMLPVYTFAGVAVDGARISSARQMISGAGELSMNSALSSYDDVLKSVYGLFAMSETPEELEENLSVYFNDTIEGSSLIDSGDEETRKYLNSIRSIFSDPEDMSFDNLIDLSTENFCISGVRGAVLANPTVIKNQIIEYMKYLGPISIGKGFITKLGVLKDFNKQSKAIEAKVGFDEKLNDIQNICDSIYSNINRSNTLMNQKSEIDTATIGEAVSRVREKYKLVSEHLVMLNSSLLQINEINSDGKLIKLISDEARAAELQEIEYIRDSLDSFINCEINESGGYTLKETQFFSEYSNTNSIMCQNCMDHEAQIKYVHEINKQLSSDVSSYNVTYTLITEYDKYYSKLSDTDRNALNQEHNLYMEYKNKIEDQIQSAMDIRSGWKNEINSYCTDAADIINELHDASCETLGCLKYASDETDRLISEISAVEKSGQEWSEAISELPDGEVKSSMKSEYENGVRSVNRDDVSELKAIVDSNISRLEKIKTKLEAIRFNGQSICADFDYCSKYCDDSIAYSVCDMSGVNSAAQNVMNDKFEEGGSCESVTYKRIGAEYLFYSYLEKICSDSDSTVQSKENKDADSVLNSLGSSSNIEEADLSESATLNVSAVLSQDCSDKIKSLLTAEASEDSYTVNDCQSDNKDEMLENQKKMLSSSADFLKNIGDLALNVTGSCMDKLYLSEYITEMFSCYTTDISSQTGTIKSHTLSGVELSPENNIFYRSEAEYILWGNDSMEKNHQYTKALLLGTRFVLNSVYAFTDAEVKAAALAAATAIAGWTGFGIPVVKTVIIMSLALAESVIDTNQLINGQSVPVYKTKTTWNMKPSGVLNMVTNKGTELARLAADKTGEKIDDVFTKIDEFTDDEVDEITDTVCDYIDDMSKQAVVDAVNLIMAPVQDAVYSVIDYTDEIVTKEKIAALVTEKFEINQSDIFGDDISSIAKKYVLELANEKINDISEIIYQKYRTFIDSPANKIEEIQIETITKINELTKPFTDKVNSKIRECSEIIKKQLSDGILNAGDKAKEYATDMVSSYITGASTALTDKINSGDSISFTKQTDGTSGKAITMTYKEYLKIFIMLSMLSGEKESAMMSRTATLIHINMNNGMNNIVIDNQKYDKPDSFDISEAYTMVELNASASIRTWFFGVIIPNCNMNKDGKIKYEYDYSNLGKKDKIITYKSILSY